MTHKEALKRALKELIQARINMDHGQKNGVPPEQMAALREKVAYRETVVEALRLIPHAEPLTLEQLREMDGKPVWIDTGNQYSDWGKVDFKRFRVWPFGQEDSWWDFGHYGEWKPYAYPPANLDREAFFGEWEGEADGYAGGELVYDIWKCPGCSHVEETDEPDFLPNFCPDCGMALTPKGWAMLEKRLRG